MSPRAMPSKDPKQAEDGGALLMRSMTIVCEDSVRSHPMCQVSPRVMPSKDSKLSEDCGALLMGSRTIITEFSTDSDSIAQASAIAIVPTMHGPHEEWQIIEPIVSSSKSRRRKVLSECTRKELKVHKRPAAAAKKAPTCKAACPKNAQAARIHIDAKDHLP